MISKVKALKWLESLKFIKISNDVYEINVNNSIIRVNITNSQIIYPSEIFIGRNTTTNFSAEENFVILDIVIGLLKQGYLSSNIEIEHEYRLGRVKKSGNADVTVKDNYNNTFMIIEAKTYGKEFEKAWKETLINGGQIFSYERQENTAEVIVLYASEITDNLEMNRKYHAIHLIDNKKFLESLDNPLSYSESTGGEDKFKVWKNTYQSDYLESGVLEADIKPFSVAKQKLSVKNLKEIKHSEVQKKYNQFASILRKYNVGGRENAFDKLINLFLAKIVDEQQNTESLKFIWNGAATDSYFDLVDRLQKLYQLGMEKFLNESVTYVAEDDVKNAFRLREDAAKDAILDYFKQLKYFSNNDFTFLEVYNENLFYQNSKILIEIVKMFERIKLRTENQNQFLGDLFEGFLDNGVKQSEGQFFTPLPIVKFIVSSLPIEKIIYDNDVPKVIDYACGAGHFLNEYAEQIKSYVEPSLLSKYYSNIYGIEKEYRLSKVAKVSAFMYGQEDINIIYSDGLKKNDFIPEKSYSLVIANPPYSVKGFLSTLDETDRKRYLLYNDVKDLDSNNNIESFFVERTIELLKPEGIAAIILPVALLSNGHLYTITRKLIIRNFHIVAISEFGSNTFGSTGVNTITLFLRKRSFPPEESKHFEYALNRWFNNEISNQGDDDLIRDYTKHLGIDFHEYEELKFNKLENLKKYDLFNDYFNEFKKSTKRKNISNKKINDKFTSNDKNKELNDALLEYVKNNEKEKILYYCLAKNQPNKVVVIKTPESKKDAKIFLGYEWSKRRGQEGIKYIGTSLSDDEMEISKNSAISRINTKLFNPYNLNDESKVNTVIRKNFINQLNEIPEELEDYGLIADLTELMDFSRTKFDANIKLTPNINYHLESNYEIDKLKNLVDVKIGGTPSREKQEFYNGDYNWVSIAEMNGNIIYETKEKITDLGIKNSNVKLIPKDTTLLSFKLTVGKVAIAGNDLYTNEAIAALIPKDSNKIMDKYLFYLFDSKVINLTATTKAFGKSLNKTMIENDISIPVPPKDIQEKIIIDLEKIDSFIDMKYKEVEKLNEKIVELYRKIDNSEGKIFRLSSDIFNLSIGNRVLDFELSENGIPVYSANVVQPKGFINRNLIKDFNKHFILWGIDGDWMVNLIPPNNPFYPTDHCGYLTINTDEINPKYLSYKLFDRGQKEQYSRSYRASIDRIRKLSFKIPEIAIQNKYISLIIPLEKKISDIKKEINKLQESKSREFSKYVKVNYIKI
ncbi:N-6 DNA methylase [Staphylococcus aureus]|uniref:N-6 DNA methylase n=1 Tax=Staphylococcus aureus TaxID=1280 RepID=UPI003F16B1DB